MKKITAIVITFLALLLMTSNAYAVETGDSTICSLIQLDAMAKNHGYEVIADTADGVVRQYTCTVNGMEYTVTLSNKFLTKSAAEVDSDLPGTITGTHILIDGNNVIAGVDFLKGLFINYVTFETVEDTMLRCDFLVDEEAPVPHYLLGDEQEGISIIFWGNTVRVFYYGETYGEVEDFDLMVTHEGKILVPAEFLAWII